MKLINAILTFPITFFIIGCERESNTPHPISNNARDKTSILDESATNSDNVKEIKRIITASDQTLENRCKQILVIVRDSSNWPLLDRLELIRFFDSINFSELGYDDQEVNLLSNSLLSDLVKIMDGDKIVGLVNSLTSKIFKRDLLVELADYISICGPKSTDYINLLEKIDSRDDRDRFLSSAISTTSNLPVETREETVKILAAQINKEIDPDPNLAKMLGVTLFTSLKEYPIPDQNITDVVEISNMFRSVPALFEAYVSGFLMFYLENNGVEATQWLLQQDNDWIGYGAPTVAEYIIRTDKEAGLEWLKRAYPNAKIQEATNFTIRELNE
jgi:hypothetical protein